MADLMSTEGRALEVRLNRINLPARRHAAEAKGV
jgi:hypothetical protein